MEGSSRKVKEYICATAEKREREIQKKNIIITQINRL